MQYKMYSDSPEYLPVMPSMKFEAISNESIKVHLADSFVFLGGKSKYFENCDVGGAASDLNFEQIDNLRR